MEECQSFKAKLRFRRALAWGEPGPLRNLEGALEDLREAAQLMPESRDVRQCLANCKRLLRGEPEAPEAPEKGGGEVAQLSGRQELVAECLGRCLGKLRRLCAPEIIIQSTL